MMLLISGEEKPIGFFKPDSLPEEGSVHESDRSRSSSRKKKSKKDKKKSSKSKSKKKKKSSGSDSDSEGEYYSKYSGRKFIKLFRGKKTRKGFLGAVETKRKINFEVFKDEFAF
jgi:hypothetical protein